MSESGDAPVLEIQDPAIDGEAVLRRVAESVAQRRADGAYGTDPDLLGPEALRPLASTADEQIRAYLELEALHQALGDMTGQAHLHEWVFTSSLPVLGRLVAAVRNAWSWMAARWIGQHLGRQQTGFNEATVRFSGELLHWQEANLWRVRELEGRIRALEARLARLERALLAEKEGDR